MARSDLILALADAALRTDTEDARRAIETISREELRKGHGHVAERLADLLRAATPLNPQTGTLVNSAFRPGTATRESSPTRRLSDIRLNATSFQILQDVLSEQRHTTKLRSVGLEPRHRLLLVGPPGTGKTTIASAFAAELGIPLQTVQYESVIGSYLGETSSRLKDMFGAAARGPCVLFLDEFDTLAKERGDTNDAGEVKRVVSTLLLQLDSLPSHVVLIAATNHDELLDRAAWRRFQAVVRLPLPTTEERASFATELAQRIGLSQSGDVAELGRSMENQSYAAIEEEVFTLRRREVIGAASI